MSGKRQKNQGKQLQLAFTGKGWGEAPDAAREGTEPLTAERSSESPGLEERLMKEVNRGSTGGQVNLIAILWFLNSGPPLWPESRRYILAVRSITL